MSTSAGAVSSTQAAAPKWMAWTGWILTILPAGMLVFSAAMKLMRVPVAVEGFAKMGYPDGVVVPIGVVELLCAVLLVIPRTAVLGAILVAAYLGGAVNTHVRMNEPFITPIALGVMAWAGLYLRDARIRALVPFRK